MVKFKFPVEVIVILIKSIKIGIKWYIHFIQKLVILFAINLPKNVHGEGIDSLISRA